MATESFEKVRSGTLGGAQGSRREPPGRHVPAILAVIFSAVWIFGGTALALSVANGGTSGQVTARSASTAPAGTTPVPVSTSAPGPAPVSSLDIAKSASDLPGPISPTSPATVTYTLTTTEVKARLDDGTTYNYWTFDNTVPGPFLRVRQGDTVNITIKNAMGSMMPHSIDLHAVTGPGGGSVATQTLAGKESTFSFRALNAGLYIYHCATAPVPMHVANGMFGMILVEPPGGLPRVDHELYVMQSEIYTDSPLSTRGEVQFSYPKLMAEQPTYYVFNGRVGSLMKQGAPHVKTGESVRIYFGVGTFKSANFHVIGAIFDTVYSDGGFGGAVEHNVGVINVPAGGTTIVEMTFKVPGTYLVVDHALQRVSEGASGQIIVDGPANPDVFNGNASAPMVH